MILVSFFSEGNVLSDEVKICYIFEYQSNENRAFRFFGTLGIVCAQTSSPVIHTFPSITPPTEHLPSHRYLWGMISDYQTIFRYLQQYVQSQTPEKTGGKMDSKTAHILVLFVICILAERSSGCGITTHTVIGKHCSH